MTKKLINLRKRDKYAVPYKSIVDGIRGNQDLVNFARHGRLDVVKYLIENGADVHTIDDQVLKLSVDNGHLEVVKFLIEHDNTTHMFNQILNK